MNKKFTPKYSEACPICGRINVVEYDNLLIDDEDFVANIKQYLSDSVRSHIEAEHMAVTRLKPDDKINQFTDMFGKNNEVGFVLGTIAIMLLYVVFVRVIVWAVSVIYK